MLLVNFESTGVNVKSASICRRNGPKVVTGKQPNPGLCDSGLYPWSLLFGLMLSVLVSVGAEGCAFSRGDLGAPLDAARISDIKEGRTTEAQVIALLGAPDR